jgi:hypothetical protein
VFKGFSLLWGHFGVQGTSSRLCGSRKRFVIFGSKTTFFVFNLGSLKSHCFKDSFNPLPIKVEIFHKPCGH